MVVNCKNCNKEFIIQPYRKDTAKCCSYKCDYLYRKGKKKPPFTEEHKRKISDANKGKKCSWTSEYNKNRKGVFKHKEETKEKIRKANSGEKSKVWKGGKPSCIKCGKQLSGYKNLLCKNCYKEKLNSQIKEKNPAWHGGKSFEVYSVSWTETLRRSIRERDRYTCKLCNKQQGEELHSIHHIDYDKKNCNPNNLITLCRNCHSMTNINRNYWIRILTVLDAA